MMKRKERPRRILGYRFRNTGLLHEALTHPSLRNSPGMQNAPDNQRLEFLGDAVLGLLAADHLFQRLENDREGMLTRTRSMLTRGRTLACIAREQGLGQHLLMSRGEDDAGGRDRDSTLADALEAVIGAVYLDGGMRAARKLFDRVMTPQLEQLIANGADPNPKGTMQEIMQRDGLRPAYRIVAVDGPPHEREYTAVVEVNGHELGRGIGRTKQQAETGAARNALKNRGNRREDPKTAAFMPREKPD